MIFMAAAVGSVQIGSRESEQRSETVSPLRHKGQAEHSHSRSPYAAITSTLAVIVPPPPPVRATAGGTLIRLIRRCRVGGAGAITAQTSVGSPSLSLQRHAERVNRLTRTIRRQHRTVLVRTVVENHKTDTERLRGATAAIDACNAAAVSASQQLRPK